MPRPPTLPPGSTRFFAQVDKFSCECPACGQLIRAAIGYKQGGRAGQKQLARPTRAKHRTYNPLTQRLSCPGCRKVYQVGLLLYPVVQRSTIARQPVDTAPEPRELLALRQQYAGGWWLQRAIKSGDEVNLALGHACTCPQPYGWAAACPIHGWIPGGKAREEGGESEG